MAGRAGPRQPPPRFASCSPAGRAVACQAVPGRVWPCLAVPRRAALRLALICPARCRPASPSTSLSSAAPPRTAPPCRAPLRLVSARPTPPRCTLPPHPSSIICTAVIFLFNINKQKILLLFSNSSKAPRSRRDGSEKTSAGRCFNKQGGNTTRGQLDDDQQSRGFCRLSFVFEFCCTINM